jgi:uncharacterized protein
MSSILSVDNQLFALARRGRRLPHLLVAVPLSFAFLILAQIAGGVLLLLPNLAAVIFQSAPFSPASLLPTTASGQVLLLVFSFGPIFLTLWLWLFLFEKRPLWTLGLRRAGALRNYLRGLLIGLLMFAAAVGVSALLGYIAFEKGDPQSQGLAALDGVLLVFLGWTVQGPAEEALTRGWLLPVIGARYRPWLGVAISAVIFTVYHSFNPGLNPIAMLNLLLFGIFAALFALYEGGLWGVFSIHAVWNWAQGNVFGLEVSGLASPGGTLLNLVETGPDAVTGGAFGPEGGLAVTLVVIVSTVILILWASWKSRVNKLDEAS